ncbi:hypothetical protein A3Q56_08677, partial [Intoshia linei]
MKEFFKLFNIVVHPKKFLPIENEELYNLQLTTNCRAGYVNCRNVKHENIEPLGNNEIIYEEHAEVIFNKIVEIDEYDSSDDSMEDYSNLDYHPNISQSDIVEISEKLGYSVYFTVSIVNEVMKIIGYKKFATSSIQKRGCNLNECQEEIKKIISNNEGDLCLHFDTKSYIQKHYLLICISGDNLQMCIAMKIIDNKTSRTIFDVIKSVVVMYSISQKITMVICDTTST